MKLSLTVEGLPSLARFDPEPLLARLRGEVERELQAAATSGAPLDSTARRDALARALARIQAPRVRS